MRGVFAKRYTVLLADRSSGVVRRFTIQVGPTLASCLSILALPILIGLGARWSARVEIADLRTDNTRLETENQSYRLATEQLSSQVSSLQTAVVELGDRATLDPALQKAMEKLPAFVKARAMGGTELKPSLAPMLTATLSSPENTFGVLRDLLGALEQRLERMRPGVERKRELAAATPSIWPVAGWLSSGYGRRSDPFTGDAAFHPGLDISADRGEPVLVTADGKVESAGSNGNYGKLIIVSHGFGITTRYGHLSRFVVNAGQRVRRGEIIGYVGSTGRSTSPHLHYEVWLNDRLVNPLQLLTTGR